MVGLCEETCEYVFPEHEYCLPIHWWEIQREYTSNVTLLRNVMGSMEYTCAYFFVKTDLLASIKTCFFPIVNVYSEWGFMGYVVCHYVVYIWLMWRRSLC